MTVDMVTSGVPGVAPSGGERGGHSTVGVRRAVAALPVGAGLGAGVLPLEAVRRAVAALVGGGSGGVTVREVAALRLLRVPAPGEVLVAEVACHPAGHGDLVATARCACAGEPVAVLTVRLAVAVRDD
jgi:hypothetical protein